MKDKSDGSEDAQGADIPKQQEEQAPQGIQDETGPQGETGFLKP